MTEHAIRNGGTSWNRFGDGALETPERLGEWTPIAALSPDRQQTIVLENPAGTDGSIVYLTGGGVLPPRSKIREPTAEQRTQLYRAPIREEEPANGHEPTCDEVSKVSSLIRRARKVGLEDRNGPHTITISTPQTVDTYPIYYGKECGARLDSFALTSGTTSAVVGEYFSRGVVGERLPTVRTFYSADDLISWNGVVFAGVHATNLFQQPSFHRYLRLENGQVNEALCLDSYLPYRFDSSRVWTELMGSGLIPRQALGAIGNHKYIGVVLAHSHGRRFLQRDMVEALLLCFALISRAYARGTWSASGCVDLNRDRQEHTPRAAAAELVVAPLAKMTLVFENPNDESYGLAKATPREWLTHSGQISATRAPTHYGVVEFRINSRIDKGRVTAKATVKPHDVTSPSSIYLRLHTSGRWAIASVGIKGSAWPVSDSGSKRITLSGGGRGSTLQIQHA